DAQTAKLAARENRADLISGIDLTHEDKDVAGILLDLVQRDTMNQSNFFAEKLVASFKRDGIRILDNPHRSAGFAVLKAPDIPSILIEAGFVSNRHDAKLLTQSSYQKKVAKTIAQGVDAYLSQIDKN
ncbi:MAG TPA: N-acetylmuramoyl-L-alanine amidase, partial [Rhodospirillaceae bacterium]|nr:N-acetylmuramoyl-L-alanine amidase [Rhodospirillaceae bacterium]